MNKIVELFGLNCRTPDVDITKAVLAQRCPYTCAKCIKARKSRPNVAIGTCTVFYQGNDIIICPFRLIERRQVFLDCLHLLMSHEPGNSLYVIPEIAIPGGNVDYFLVSVKDGKVVDFVGIELQTMDTTGTVWPERQRLLAVKGMKVLKKDVQSTKSFGMNWKMTAKTILVQLHHKAQTFENLNRHLVLVIQKPFLDYMTREFSFNHVNGPHIGDAVHVHSYSLGNGGNAMSLVLDKRYSTDVDGVARCLGLQVRANVAFSEITALLESKLREEYRLTIG